MVAAYRDSIEGMSSGSTISVAASGLTVAADDALVLHVWGFNTLGTPSGSDVTWTQIENASATGPYGDTCTHKVFVGIAPDAALSDFTISNGKSDSWFYTLVSVSDADTTTPVDASDITAANSAAGAPTAPSISPAGSDSLLICGVGLYPFAGDALITGAPSGMTLREDGQDWETYGMATLGLSASGATGTKVFSRSGSDIYAYVASSVAIKTASAGGGDPEGSLLHGKLIRGGLLRGGVLV